MGDNSNKEGERPSFGRWSLEEAGLAPVTPKTRRSHGLEEALWMERWPLTPDSHGTQLIINIIRESAASRGNSGLGAKRSVPAKKLKVTAGQPHRFLASPRQDACTFPGTRMRKAPLSTCTPGMLSRLHREPKGYKQ